MWLQSLTLPFAVPGLVRYFSTVRLYGFHCKVGSGAVDEEQLDRDCVDPVAYFVTKRSLIYITFHVRVASAAAVINSR